MVFFLFLAMDDDLTSNRRKKAAERSRPLLWLVKSVIEMAKVHAFLSSSIVCCASDEVHVKTTIYTVFIFNNY